jgi:hypothetical protein
LDCSGFDEDITLTGILTQYKGSRLLILFVWRCCADVGKKTRGRDLKLTPEIQKLIIDAVAACTPRRYAADRAGVDESTIRRWVIKGRKQKKGIYFTFFTALKKAEAEAVIARIARIGKAGQGGQVVEETTKTVTVETRDGKKTTTTTATRKLSAPQWQADAWALERRCPDDFALQRKKDIEEAVKKELTKALKKESNDLLTNESNEPLKHEQIEPPHPIDGSTGAEAPPA